LYKYFQAEYKMEKIGDLINALKVGDNASASTTFDSVMSDKINDVLDDRRISIAQSMMGTQPEIEAEEELEFDGEVDVDDENIQGISSDETE
jgi:hypothetical protein